MKKKDFKTSIQQKIDLPSHGIPYGDTIPESFNLRPLTVNETKMLYGSSNISSALDTVLEKCIDVEDFPVKKLLIGDKLYLVYQLRALTFGENYDITLKCPHCSKQVDVSFNLAEAEIDYATDDFEMYKNIGKLPVSGDEIVTKILTVGDYENIIERAQQIKSDYPDYEGDPFIPLSLAFQIYTINGDKLNIKKREQYASDMHAMDELYISEKITRVSVGPKAIQHIECPECEKDIAFQIRTSEEFFRPKINF